MLWPRTFTFTPSGEEIELVIRPIAEEDSIAELTTFLHRSYRVLADMGLRFFATHQTEEQTLGRVRAARCCLVGLLNGRIVATVCYGGPGEADGAEWYERPDVAFLSQFAVEPELRRLGIGAVLMDLVEQMAIEDGAAELAMDTAEPAEHLIRYYSRRGYRPVQSVQWKLANYRSVILSRRLAGDASETAPETAPETASASDGEPS